MTKKKAPAIELPPSVLASDLKYPTGKDALARDVGDYGQLTFYKTASFGWCVTTLGIRNRRGSSSARTYAARVSDGLLVRVGQGPHVVAQVTIYVRESRRDALARYLELHRSGAVQANEVRDRISSRRAQGQRERAKGRTYWRWDV